MWFPFFLPLCLLATSCLAKDPQPVVHDESFRPDHVLRVTRGEHTVGCETRQSFLVNGTSPGPEIRIPAGKVSWIRVYNDAEDADITMHWHGLSERMAPFSDGTPAASQFVTPPGHYFDYEVLPGELDAGTYFYHSHVGLEAQTAYGALIVEDIGAPPYKYDEERVVAFADYFNRTDEVMFNGLVGNPFKWSGETNAILINGQGVSNTVTSGSDTCKRPSLEVDCGKTYRFRFIGGTALSVVSWKIEGHNVTIIAADARYTQPYEVEHLQFGSGQRFDVLLKTMSCQALASQPRKTFWAKFQSKGRPAVYTGYAALQYAKEDIPFTPPDSAQALDLPDTLYTWLESALEPYHPNDFPSTSEVTRRLTITVQQYGSPNATIQWAQNGLTWNESLPHRAVLPSIYEYGQAAIPDYAAALANNGWDPSTKLWPAKIGEVLEIILINTGSKVNNGGGLDNHPFHAHAGHHYDAGFGCGTYNAAAHERLLQNYKPVLRDTTTLYRCNAKGVPGQADSWRAWRIRVSNPGVWVIHCHILPHMPMGMQMLFVFGDAEEIRKIPIGAARGYYGADQSVLGNASQVPVLLHYFQDKVEQPWE